MKILKVALLVQYMIAIVTSLSFSSPSHAQDESYQQVPDTVELNNFLILDLSDRVVSVYKDNEVISRYPVAVGRSGWETPPGEFVILHMERFPIWQNPFTKEIIPPGADNPLGTALIGVWINEDMSMGGFHGTPNTELIGQAVSHGCIRMYNNDVLKLFEQVRLGMQFRITP